jgi:hypothetical protein
MSSGPHQYKQREASRAIRAAKAAGIKNPEIEIDLGGGRRMIIRDGDRGRASGSDKATKQSESAWDEVLSDHDQDQKRTS